MGSKGNKAASFRNAGHVLLRRTGPRSTLAWRTSPDSEGMYALPRNIAKGSIDHALTLQARRSRECCALDLHREVGFAGAIVAGMAAMAGAVVHDGEVSGAERFG
jgi:hypothetical protein